MIRLAQDIKSNQPISHYSLKGGHLEGFEGEVQVRHTGIAAGDIPELSIGAGSSSSP